MQRYSNGLAVPKQMMEIFTGRTGDGSGDIICNLRYVPKSINHIIVPDGFRATLLERRLYHKVSLTGAALTLRVQAMDYQKADTPTAGGNSGGAGGDPHTHDITHTLVSLERVVLPFEAQAPIVVHYKVA